MIWHILSDPEVRYVDLGNDWHDRQLGRRAQTRRLVLQFRHLGYTVTLTEHDQTAA